VFRDVEQGRAAVDRLRARRFDAQHLDLVGGGVSPAEVADAAGVAAGTQAGPEQSVADAIFDRHLPPEQVDVLKQTLHDGGVALVVTTSAEHDEQQAMDGLREAGAENVSALS
jgi:hypothetical protein